MSTKKKKGPSLISLTPEQLRRLPRPHAGFDQFAEELVALYEANPKTLQTDDFDAASILDSLRAYQALRVVEVEAQKHLALVQQTRLYHASNAWVGELEVYARATRAGRTDADVKRGIAAFTRYMKSGLRKKGAVTTPVVPAATTTP